MGRPPRRQALSGPDAHCRAPLCEPGTCFVVVLSPLLPVIRPSAPLPSTLATHENDEAGVNLDTRYDRVLLGQLDDELSICRFLVQSFQRMALRAKQKLPPLLSVWFCLLNADRLQTQAAAAVGLVRAVTVSMSSSLYCSQWAQPS